MDTHKIKKAISIILFCLICTTGCTRKSTQKQTKKTLTKENQEKVLTLYNWEDYIGSETLENFKEETGIHVKEVNFEDEEEMLGAVQSDLSAFDEMEVSDDMVREMTAT